jgi:hypothetical protein
MIKLSTFNTRLDTLLQGIDTGDLSDADRNLAVRHAVSAYGRDVPKREVVEFAGDGKSYYLLYGRVIDVDEAGRDAGIDLTSSGADNRLGIAFTLARRMELHGVSLWLQRTGSTVAGTLYVEIYTDESDLPGQLVCTSESLDLDGVDGAPLGRYDRVRFTFSTIYELPAGDYHAVLRSSGYTYADGSAEVILGVDQSGVTNTVSTYNASWSAYGTDSAGIIEVLASTPGWREGVSSVDGVEYPAATIDDNEEPQVLEREEITVYETEAGEWLRLIGYSPASTETVRVSISNPYVWLEASDPLIDTPLGHFEAVCNLAASVSCEWLATRYGQKRSSSIAADSVERRTQSDVYLSLANRFKKAYEMLLGKGEAVRGPGMQLVDVDYAYEVGSDFLFHRKSKR